MAAAVLGFMVSKFFGNHPINALFIGGVSFIIAAIVTLRVEDRKGQLR